MSRYSFVLVDDEPEIREGIRDTIPWEDLGFSFAGARANGFEALELAERIRPDVVMTDINMPFMDGLALADRLLSALADTKVLIISGYDDFEYARKALRLQVYDYIVKPISPGEFKNVLTKLKQTLDAEQESRRDLEHIKKQLAESIPLLRERFLVHLIEGRLDRNTILERLAYEALAWGLLREKFGITAYREVMGKTDPSRGGGTHPGWCRGIVSALKIGAGEEARRHIRAMTDYFKNTPLTIDEYHIKLRLVLAALLQGMEDMEIPRWEIFPPPLDPFADIKRLRACP
ncbi:MAG: response regulator [Treponema sp.]|jgi:DNA-binding NarL/FixJ family response regulator|nr:response regulator [Treponema sp.]